ncbi:MAG: tRNA lysidine(34) synthetase TilS [Isosphaeraceae bacterium]|nr:tRNA lysidine(34) synthetase TilS [Isosphaeraceae bacterium]
MSRPSPGRDSLSDRVARTVATLCAGGVGPRWVVAVSGGIDSISMLHLLAETAQSTHLELVVAHLDHGVRGEAAREDARFVERTALDLGIDCELGRWNPLRENHFESDARIARYEWLAEVARRRRAHAIATAHTLDDQVETILHRFIRGTGIEGLRGIPSLRSSSDGIVIVRPLLEVSRRELTEFLEHRGIDHRVDETNQDIRHTRNRIRLDLIPGLEADFNPRVKEAIAGLGREVRAQHERQAPHIESLLRLTLVELSPRRCVFDLVPLRSIEPASQLALLRLAWRRAGFPLQGMSRGDWTRLLRVVDGADSRIDLPGRVAASTTHDRFSLEPAVLDDAAQDRSVSELAIPGLAIRPDLGGRLVVSLDQIMPCDESVDFDRLTLPLTLSTANAGERFDPLGMQGHSMPLSDFLRNRGVPRPRRRHVPIVRDGHGIVWVVGHRIAERIKITEQTRRPLHLAWIPLPGETAS